jgi:ribonuclease BN (tRNA processing enzyme)
MKLVVLGSGASVPDGRRNGPGLWVEDEGLGVLIDCGVGTLPALVRRASDWTALTHVVLTHFHLDHIVELPALLFALRHAPAAAERVEPLTVAGPAGTGDLLGRWEQAVGTDFTNLHFDVRIRELEPGAPCPVPGGALTARHAPHTDESLALRIDVRGTSVGCTGDTGPSGDLAPFFEACDLLVADCSLPEPRSGVHHLSTGETAQLASDARVTHLVATHLVPEQDEEVVLRKISSIYGGRVTVASDGLSIHI